ncbi:MAG: SDR family oxidoreductase [Bdellovibrionales bacterium]|nr:SDR family oxidoreductase [Bdellovibrionales bacterium]
MKHVIVTGASSGIGKSIAQQFFNQGWTPILLARNEERLKSLSESLSQCPYYVCDLTEADSIHASLSDILKQEFRIQALVNNAGAYQPKSIDKDDDHVWDFHFQTNLMSAVRMTRGLWANLKESGGAILNISSTLAIRPIERTAAYSALKAAMNNWTLALAIEGAPHGIRANAICPGLVQTPIHTFFDDHSPEGLNAQKIAQAMQPLGRVGQPKDIAATAVHLCSDESSWTTGVILNIDGGILLKS